MLHKKSKKEEKKWEEDKQKEKKERNNFSFDIETLWIESFEKENGCFPFLPGKTGSKENFFRTPFLW